MKCDCARNYRSELDGAFSAQGDEFIAEGLDSNQEEKVIEIQQENETTPISPLT